MTPKEKAKELFEKFDNLLICSMDVNWDAESKQCALIAVDEILNVPELSFNQNDYWREVKSEIQNL